MRYFCNDCNIVQKINDLQVGICQLQKQLEPYTDLKNEVKQLKQETVELKKDVNEGTKKQRVASNELEDQLFQEELITKISDRQRRANNVIVYNLPESDPDVEIDRKNADVLKFIDTIGKDVVSTTSVKKSQRLGKSDPAKTRPLLITLNSTDEVANILRHCRTKDRIYVNRDLTVRQRNIAYAVRSEFKHRKEQGEDDVKLKYTNGMPRIVKNQPLPNEKKPILLLQ